MVGLLPRAVVSLRCSPPAVGGGPFPSGEWIAAVVLPLFRRSGPNLVSVGLQGSQVTVSIHAVIGERPQLKGGPVDTPALRRSAGGL